ncbi:M15 family metallopeptidase [Candidatus Sumerlaeota bacterium]|nr:M15 family metallopeptidase [Candidatus Sumerlaeota bacterium]
MRISQSAEDPGKKEWTVWSDGCPVYATTQLDTETTPLAALSKGDVIEGIKYFRNADYIEWIAFRHEGQIAYAPFAWLTHVPDSNKAEGDLPIGGEIVDRWNSLPDTYEPGDLVSLPASYCYTQNEFRLRREAWEALKVMLDDARADGCKIWVASAYRSYSWQSGKFLQKVEKEGLGQRVSAKPGHSEHQLGVTVDLVGPDPKLALEQEFGETKEGQWIETHCGRYGFRLTYTEDNETETGYIAEPWHLRYLGKPMEE